MLAWDKYTPAASPFATSLLCANRSGKFGAGVRAVFSCRTPARLLSLRHGREKDHKKS
jgi:hypothetical protein